MNLPNKTILFLFFACSALLAQEYTANAVALWHFNKGSGSSASDASGIETLTSLIFTANTQGKSVIQFTFSCEFMDTDDNPIEIKGFGEGVSSNGYVADSSKR